MPGDIEITFCSFGRSVNLRHNLTSTKLFLNSGENPGGNQNSQPQTAVCG